MITQKILKEYFRYHKNGWLVRKKPLGPRTYIGQIVKGSPQSRGYLRLRFKMKDYYAHRLIFLLVKGFLPKQIDHKDLKKRNNKIENLRPASINQNRWNTKRRTGKGRHKGLYIRPDRLGYYGSIMKNKKYHRVSGKTKRETLLKLKSLRESLHQEFCKH